LRNNIAGPGNVVLTFATPILKKTIADTATVNEGLKRIALEREKTMPSTGRSNVGGWHSNDDLFDWPEPEIATFRSWVGEAVGEISNIDLDGRIDGNRDVQMDGGAWVNLCRDGGYNKIHNHPGCSWSGVYYVTLGEPDPDAPPEAGKIEFLDPRMGATETGVQRAGCRPQASYRTGTGHDGDIPVLAVPLRKPVSRQGRTHIDCVQRDAQVQLGHRFREESNSRTGALGESEGPAPARLLWYHPA
jgi:uncharacterized protein (TIGR02466 family)